MTSKAAPVLGFQDRLAYLRWLRNRGRRAPETDAELAGDWQVGLQWLRKWKARPDAPPGRDELKAIEGAIGSAAAAWLYDGAGRPPEPDSWKVWYADWLQLVGIPITQNPRADRPAAESKKGRGR